MKIPANSDIVSPQQEWGAELRRRRLKAGLSQSKLCAIVPMSKSLLSALETGGRFPTEGTALGLDRALNLGTVLQRLRADLASKVGAAPTWFRPWLEHEQVARALHMWEPLMVPGLLQTEEYARAILSQSPTSTADDLESKVAARMKRQGILRRTPAPMLWVVLDEGVLYRPVADAEVMHRQFERLLEVGEQRHVSLQILPHSARNLLGLLGSFTVAELPGGDPPVAYAESQPTGHSRITGRAKEVQGLLFRHGSMRADALPRRESLNLIKETMKRWTT
ncbi:helix-turn-helix domain-containing protein [Streptosporangium saharense]|uniref:helix-turn-helix domain-containing protein n=1 Tax=Streptosporangium saharense TaxID=1706840 RepID=UPI00341254CB